MGFRIAKTATRASVKIIMRNDWIRDNDGNWTEREQFMAFAEFLDDEGNVVDEGRVKADKIASPAQIDKLRTILNWLKTEAEKEL